MGLGKPITDNLTQQFNTVYQITRDLSGWDKCTIAVVGPVIGRLNILGSNDSGAQPQNTQGNAQLAINFSPIQATDLSNGTAVNAIYGPGLFRVDVAAQFMRLQGSPAATPTSIYRLLLFNSKIN